MQKTRALPCLAVALAGLASVAAAQDLPARWDELTASDWPKAMEQIGRHLRPAHRHPREARAARPHRLGPDPRPRVVGAGHEEGVRGRLPRLLLRPDLRGAPSAGHLRAAAPGRAGPAAVHLRRDRPQRLQEDRHRERPRREPEPAALLRPDAARPTARLRRLLLRSRRPIPPSTSRSRSCASPTPPATCTRARRETSTLLYLRPDLVQMDRATQESGANQKRLALPDLYTAIWWYAGFPNHYAGEGAQGDRASWDACSPRAGSTPSSARCARSRPTSPLPRCRRSSSTA